MAKAELPSKPMAAFFEKLHAKYGDDSGLLSHLASHPDLLGRASAAKDADTIGERSFDAILSASEGDDLRSMCAGHPKKDEPKAE
jgi:hypothetical protein